MIAAKNGQEALDIFEQSGEQEIDLILMDIMMPVMDLSLIHISVKNAWI